MALTILLTFLFLSKWLNLGMFLLKSSVSSDITPFFQHGHHLKLALRVVLRRFSILYAAAAIHDMALCGPTLQSYDLAKRKFIWLAEICPLAKLDI